MAADFQDNELEGKDVQQALNGWRSAVTNAIERPDWFWTRQHARVMSKLEQRKITGFPKLAWASLAATVAIAASLIFAAHPEKQVQRQAQVPHEVQISDHDLMLAIERSMNDVGPSSLAPAGLLAEEMNQALTTNVRSQKAKESRYEN
jgi:hypothetical protein